MSVEAISHFYAARQICRKAVSFTDKLSLIHRSQQPRSGWPSNVFRRFVRR